MQTSKNRNIDHVVIPDTQIRPGVPLEHLTAAGNYIAEHRPDIVVQLGDFADMHSLSSYDKGTKAGEGARYTDDLIAAEEGMEALMRPIIDLQDRQKRQKVKQYNPRLVLTLGNHENRINRHVNSYPVLFGRLSTEDLCYAHYGYEVFPFLSVVEINGVQYSHYFPRNAAGRIVQTLRGAPSAATQVRREMRSSTAGHLQGFDYSLYQTGTGRRHGLIVGSFYMHEEEYLGPQGTAYWRGIIHKHDVNDGEYDLEQVSLHRLLKEYL